MLGVTGKFGLGVQNEAEQRLTVLPRECTGHSKHPLPITHEKTLHRDVTRSDQISCSVVSDSLQPHESQHARPPCPSPTLGVHSDSGPSSQ